MNFLTMTDIVQYTVCLADNRNKACDVLTAIAIAGMNSPWGTFYSHIRIHLFYKKLVYKMAKILRNSCTMSEKY